MLTEKWNSIQVCLDLVDVMLTYLLELATLFLHLKQLLLSKNISENKLFPFLQCSVFPFSPYLSVRISWSSFPSLDTALLSSGMEMKHFVALCQRAADWTLAWMVQQMFADYFIYLFI